MIYDKTSVGTIRRIAVTEADNEELRRSHNVLTSSIEVTEEDVGDAESIPAAPIPSKTDV